MKICFPDISNIFEIENDKINTLVIESPALLLKILRDIQSQVDGNDGQTIISVDNKPITISKNVELLSQFIPFTVNQKNLINKAIAVAEKKATDTEFYEQMTKAMSDIERLLLDITFEMTGDIIFRKINFSSIIKSIGFEFNDDYDSLAEMLIDYMQLVNEYDKEKLFILYNIHGLIDNKQMELFIDTCIRQGIKVFCIEASIHDRLSNEKVVIIDRDLCEIVY